MRRTQPEAIRVFKLFGTPIAVSLGLARRVWYKNDLKKRERADFLFGFVRFWRRKEQAYIYRIFLGPLTIGVLREKLKD